MPTPLGHALDAFTVALWRHDEVSGSTAADETGLANLSVTGSSIVAGQIGNARFSATSSSGQEASGTVTIPSALISGSMTVEAWIKHDPYNGGQTAYGTIVSVYAGTTVFDFFLSAAGALRFWDNNHSYLDSNSPDSGTIRIQTGSWYHLALVIQAGTPDTFTWYVNGRAVASITRTHRLGSGPLSGSLGVRTNVIAYPNEVLFGTIDDVRVSNIARTAAEIRDSWRRGRAMINTPLGLLNDANTVGLWKHQESSGTTVADSSFNNLTLTSSSAANIVQGITTYGRQFLGSPAVTESGSVPASIADIYNYDFQISAQLYCFGTHGGTNTIVSVANPGALYTERFTFFLTCDSNEDNHTTWSLGISRGGITKARTASNKAIPSYKWVIVGIVGTWVGSTLTAKFYLDGVLLETVVATDTPSPTSPSGNTLYIGSSSSNTDRFRGVIQEVKLSNVGRSAAYMAAESAVALGETDTPTAPQNVLAIQSDSVVRQVTLTWDDPITDGGSPITGYVITASGMTPIYLGVQNSFDLTDLPTRTRRFSVAAINGNGTGPAQASLKGASSSKILRKRLSNEIHALFFDEVSDASGRIVKNWGSDGAEWTVPSGDVSYYPRNLNGDFGRALKYDGPYANSTRLTGPTTGEPTNYITCLARFKINANVSLPFGAYSHLLFKQQQSSWNGVSVGIETSPTLQPQFVVRVGGTNYAAGDPTPLVAGVDYTIMGTYDGANIRMYIYDNNTNTQRSVLVSAALSGPIDWAGHGPWIMGTGVGINESLPMEMYEARVFPDAKDQAWFDDYVLNVPSQTVTTAAGDGVGIGSFSTSWNTPDNNGSPITDYDINVDGQFTVSYGFGTNNLSFSLRDGFYRVRTRARNAVGYGDWSEWTNFVEVSLALSQARRALENGGLLRASAYNPNVQVVGNNAGNGMTIVCWVKVNAYGGYQVIYDNRYNPQPFNFDHRGIYFALDEDTPVLGVVSTGVGYGEFRVNNSYVPAGVWFHIAFRIGPGGSPYPGRSVWIDGGRNNSGDGGVFGQATANYDSGRPHVLGADMNGSAPLNGTLDEFAIWQRALTDDEIRQLAAGVSNTKLANQAGLAVNYRFDNSLADQTGDSNNNLSSASQPNFVDKVTALIDFDDTDYVAPAPPGMSIRGDTLSLWRMETADNTSVPDETGLELLDSGGIVPSTIGQVSKSKKIDVPNPGSSPNGNLATNNRSYLSYPSRAAFVASYTLDMVLKQSFALSLDNGTRDQNVGFSVYNGSFNLLGALAISRATRKVTYRYHSTSGLQVVETTLSFVPQKWSLITVSMTDDGVSRALAIYFDAVLAGSMSGLPLWLHSGDVNYRFFCGAWDISPGSNRQHMTGWFDEIRISNTAHSPSEVMDTFLEVTATPPDAPVLDLATSPGDNQLQAGWVVPHDNGSPILDYEIEVREVASPYTTYSFPGVTSTPHTAAIPYTPTSDFRVRVRARNSVGYGPYSNPMYAVVNTTLPPVETGKSDRTFNNGLNGGLNSFFN